MTFNPNNHLMKAQGGKDYLEVKWRLVWVNEKSDRVKITVVDKHIDPTVPVTKDTLVWNEQQRKKVPTPTTKLGYAWFIMRVEDDWGNVGEGFKSECAADFDDYAEKAQTGAVGRALAFIGYGTQFTGEEFDEGERIVDAPVEHTAAATLPPATNGHKPASPPPPIAVKASTPVTAPPPVAVAPAQPPVAPALTEKQQKVVSLLREFAFCLYERAKFLTWCGVTTTDPASWEDVTCDKMVTNIPKWVEHKTEGRAKWKSMKATEEQLAEFDRLVTDFCARFPQHPAHSDPTGSVLLEIRDQLACFTSPDGGQPLPIRPGATAAMLDVLLTVARSAWKTSLAMGVVKYTIPTSFLRQQEAGAGEKATITV